MKKITIATMLVLSMAPSIAAACSVHEAHAMSCGEGQIYDAGTRTCVPSPTG